MEATVGNNASDEINPLNESKSKPQPVEEMEDFQEKHITRKRKKIYKLRLV